MRWLARSLVAALICVACSASDAKLVPAQDLPPDVRSLVTATWDAFERAFPARIDCMAPVGLELVRNVPNGDAVYHRDTARIEIEIPTSPARFPESLVHELAHHLEESCADHAELRVPFATAQGLLDAPAWSYGGEWARIPSEHFAEAVVQVVNGARLLHDDVIELTPEAIAIVAEWGRGE